MQYFSPNACTPDLWRYLQSQAGRPILLWGMGDGADKVLDVCAEYGIAAADVFASDGFVRGQSFRGRRVLSFGEARATYGDCMIVLLAFGSRRPDAVRAVHSGCPGQRRGTVHGGACAGTSGGYGTCPRSACG